MRLLGMDTGDAKHASCLHELYLDKAALWQMQNAACPRRDTQSCRIGEVLAMHMQAYASAALIAVHFLVHAL